MRAGNLERLATLRDRILDRAGVRPGDTVLDVGTGQGLLGIGALVRNAPDGRVIFSDISEPLLADCRAAAEQASALKRSSFVVASATDLSTIESESIDVVVERAVLLFIEDRSRALAEYHRVLRAGGRLSLGEPLNSWMGLDRPGYVWGYDVTEVIDLERKLHAVDEARMRRPLRSCAGSTIATSSPWLALPAFGELTSRPTFSSHRHRPATTSTSSSTPRPTRWHPPHGR